MMVELSAETMAASRVVRMVFYLVESMADKMVAKTVE